MNKQNEDSLPAAAGSHQPCLDALVHERIMGLLPVKVWIATSDGGKSCCLSDESRRTIEIFLDQYKAGMARGYSLGSWDRYPLYTEDQTASKMLRNKMRANGWGLYLAATIGNPVSVLFIKNGHRGEAHSDTEEMAVALAALKALGVVLQALPDGGAPQAKHEKGQA